MASACERSGSSSITSTWGSLRGAAGAASPASGCDGVAAAAGADKAELEDEQEEDGESESAAAGPTIASSGMWWTSGWPFSRASTSADAGVCTPSSTRSGGSARQVQ